MMATTWSSTDNVTTTLSNADLTATCTAINGSIVRATAAKASGKLYFEVTWTGAFRGNSTTTGIALLASSLASIISTSAGAVSYSASGSVFNNSATPVASGYPVWNNATVLTVCTAVDLNNDRIWFRLNNGIWNNSGTADPATNVGGIDISNLFATAAAAPIALFQGNTGIIATANFGASALAQSVPSGFTAWDLPDVPVVTAPAPRSGSSAGGGKAWETLYREYYKEFYADQIPEDEDEIKQRLKYLRDGPIARRVRIGRQGYE